MGFKRAKTLASGRALSAVTAFHNPRIVFCALYSVALNCLAMLRRAFSLASETALTVGCSFPSVLTISFSAAPLSTDPTQ